MADACVADTAVDPPHLPAAYMADKSDSQDKDIDELDDDFGSEDENADPNVFRISNALTPPAAKSYSTQELHSEPTDVLDGPLSDMPQPLFTRGTSTSTPATSEVRLARYHPPPPRSP